MYAQSFGISIYPSIDGEEIIYLRQNQDGDDDLILIHPDQVESVCAWLKKARQTLIDEGVTDE